MPKNKKIVIFILVHLIMLLSVFAFRNLFAQPQVKEGETVDKIVAVVGNEIIMQSELNGQLAMFAQQDPTMNPNDTATRKKVLNAIINEKLIITKAIEDSVTASDDEIKQAWENQLNNLVKYFGSEKRIEDVYGMSISRMQFELRDDLRKQILSQKIKMQKFGEIKVTQREVDEFYKNYKDSLPKIPAQIELYHLVRYVTTNEHTKGSILELAKKVRDTILMGGNFADCAKRYSSDPGTKNSGGELGWFEKGKLFPEFEKAAFALQIGETSNIVETPFGCHIIQTLAKNKDSVMTRHILFKAGLSDDDKEKTKAILNALKARIAKGETFEDLSHKYSEEKETQGYGGLIGKFPETQIPAGLKEIIDKLKDGDISDPMPFGNEPKVGFHIIYRKRTIKEHKPSIETDYKEIEQLATSEKQNRLMREWIEHLRATLYWELK